MTPAEVAATLRQFNGWRRDINELRRLGEGQQWIGRWYDAGCETLMAERDGEHEEVAHPMPIGLVPYLVAVQPVAISELLDRLEAAEKSDAESLAMYRRARDERDALRAKIEELHVLIAAVKKRADAEFCLRVKKEEEYTRLRAKIAEMERQEPVAEWLPLDSGEDTRRD